MDRKTIRFLSTKQVTSLLKNNFFNFLISPSLIEIRKRKFEENKEDFSIIADNGVQPEKLFSSELVHWINSLHRNPNEMDRLRFLGQALVQFIIAEWIYETQEKSPLETGI